MAWIESHHTLRNHPKIFKLCKELKINRPQALGHLHCLWWWTIENRENGDLIGLFDKDLAQACDWDGDPKKLVVALKNTGWLGTDMCVTDWHDYSWRLLRLRTSNRERQKRYRDITRDVRSYVPPATIPNLTIPNHKERTRPTQGEVISFFQDQSLANSFYDYYQANGWKIGRNPMKDWMAAARNWKRRQSEFSKNGASNDHKQRRPIGQGTPST